MVLAHEYRIPMPISVAEYKVAQVRVAPAPSHRTALYDCEAQQPEHGEERRHPSIEERAVRRSRAR